MKRVRAGDIELEVAMAGDGDRLLLCLHGFPECNHSWRHQLPFFAERGWTVWAPNLRGYGHSSRPRGIRAYRMDELVDDVAGLIDAAGRREVVLMSHDWGGAIAWEAVRQKIRPIAGHIVLNMPHPLLLLRGFRTLSQLRRSWYIGMFQLPLLPERLLGRGRAQGIVDTLANTAARADAFSAEDLEVYRENALIPGALTAMINYYRAIPLGLSAALQARDQVIDTPTLMIWGTEDPALGVELTEGTGELVSDLTLRYLPGVSHWTQQEAPDTVNRMADAWLRGETVPEAEAPSPAARR